MTELSLLSPCGGGLCAAAAIFGGDQSLKLKVHSGRISISNKGHGGVPSCIAKQAPLILSGLLRCFFLCAACVCSRLPGFSAQWKMVALVVYCSFLLSGPWLPRAACPANSFTKLLQVVGASGLLCCQGMLYHTLDCKFLSCLSAGCCWCVFGDCWLRQSTCTCSC